MQLLLTLLPILFPSNIMLLAFYTQIRATVLQLEGQVGSL